MLDPDTHLPVILAPQLSRVARRVRVELASSKVVREPLILLLGKMVY